MSINVRWGPKHTKRFVALLKSHRCIWDATMPEHKQKLAKQLAYHSIAKAMRIPGVTVVDVRNKIKNLRSTYHQEKKKILKSRDEGGAEYVPRLEWFDDFTEIISGIPSESTKSIKPELYETYDSDTEPDTEELDDVPTEYVDVNNHYVVPTPDEKPAIGRQPAADQEFDEDEFEVFSRSVAAQLQRMPLKNALRMQLKIQTLLTEERIKLQEFESRT